MAIDARQIPATATASVTQTLSNSIQCCKKKPVMYGGFPIKDRLRRGYIDVNPHNSDTDEKH